MKARYSTLVYRLSISVMKFPSVYEPPASISTSFMTYRGEIMPLLRQVIRVCGMVGVRQGGLQRESAGR
jgi:hypothetical protein